MISCRIFFHIISSENIFLWVFSNSLQRMIWVSNEIIVMLCEPYKHITIETVLPSKYYLFKVNNRNTKKRYEICSKLAIKTSERCQWRSFSFFIVNLEHISHLFLMFTVDFEQLITWNWTNNVQQQGKLSKVDTYVTKARCPL